MTLVYVYFFFAIIGMESFSGEKHTSVLTNFVVLIQVSCRSVDVSRGRILHGSVQCQPKLFRLIHFLLTV